MSSSSFSSSSKACLTSESALASPPANSNNNDNITSHKNYNSDGKATTMEMLLHKLLVEGGVGKNADDRRHDSGPLLSTSKTDPSLLLLDRLEAWVGLPPSQPLFPRSKMGFRAGINGDNAGTLETTMEDDAPFPPSFYSALEKFLIETWKPTSEKEDSRSQTSQTHTSGPQWRDITFDLLHQQYRYMMVHDEEDPMTVSLFKSVLSIRVTRLVRYWMELNVMGMTMEGQPQTTSGHDGKNTGSSSYPSLSTELMKYASSTTFSTTTTTSSSIDSSKRNFHQQQSSEYHLLIDALFRHIQQLPVIQAQINVYTKSLMMTNITHQKINPATALIDDAQTRIKKMEIWQQTTARLSDEWEQHLSHLEYIVGEWYEVGSSTVRKQCRAYLGSIWSQFLSYGSGTTGPSVVSAGLKIENTSSAAISMSLKVLRRVLLGIPSPSTTSESTTLPKSYEHLLFHHLIPLHRPSSMVLWRDQTSLLDLYHEPLVQCIAIIIQRSGQSSNMVISKVISALLQQDIWDYAKNTSKAVLLLHEIDTYLGCLPEPIQGNELSTPETGGGKTIKTRGTVRNSNGNRKNLATGATMTTFQLLLKTIGTCMASENSRLAQRALPFIQNETFQRLLCRNLSDSLETLLPYLLRKEPSWNPTVRKMTYHVLSKLRDMDGQLFVEIGNRCLIQQRSTITSQSKLVSVTDDRGMKAKYSSTLPPKAAPESRTEASSSNLPTDFTILSAMGEWKPPSAVTGKSTSSSSRLPNHSMGPPLSLPSQRRKATGGGRANPPLGVTGIAPWAINAEQKITNLKADESKKTKNPPFQVTGVEPWAMRTLPSQTQNSQSKYNRKRGVPRNPGSKTSETPFVEENAEETLKSLSTTSNDEDTSRTVSTSFSGVLAYMEKIKPPKEEEGASSWAKDQMEESPTLLPDLKFHDLVFGHELGGGAFGVVRYARLIDRTKTRSHWAEYAVKIISTEKIIEMGYEPSVQREIAVLRMLSHPCITRLISSFRFREGVYLVLEYASKGDLHTLLKKNGSIDHNSARFIIGEVTAALNAIHDMDFVYADLKPENIVITETGHVKLTDFGGTRPVSETAKAMIKASASNLLRNMRDGDWKSMKTSGSKFDMDDGVNDDDDVMKNGEYDPNADDRVEGTTAYLPPEVVLGAVPTKAADSWALGCVLYQCLSGRPPMLESDDSKTKSKIVSFDSNTGPTDDESVLFLDSHATHIERNARDLIIQLLNRVQTSRPSMRQVADHGFFTDAGVSIWTLHKEAAHPIEIGDVEPVVDAHWTRRQLSTIWAPQPQTYDVSAEHAGSSHGQSAIVSTRSEPIQEGEERTAFFSKANLLPSLFSASQFVPLPPRREITEA